jgi:hypothetical protein
MRNCLSELQEQELAIAWARSLEHKYPKLHRLHCSLNGVWLPPKLAKQAKDAGMERGVPDLQLPVPMTVDSTLYYGLWIELKALDGKKPSTEQFEWLSELAADGYYAVWCKGAKAAIAVITKYMNIKPEDANTEWL